MRRLVVLLIRRCMSSPAQHFIIISFVAIFRKGDLVSLYILPSKLLCMKHNFQLYTDEILKHIRVIRPL